MIALVTALLLLQDPVYSGPQPGEKAPAFPVRVLKGADGEDLRFDPAGQPTAIVFVHEVTRPVAQLLREFEAWAAPRRAKLRVLYVLLSADKIASLNFAPNVIRACNLPEGTLAVSPDGLEGPGAYGLNRQCQVTALVVKDGVVAANFAIVSPTAAVDGPRLRAAARAASTKAPATLEEALAEIRALEERIDALEAQLAAARPAKPAMEAPKDAPKKDLPGAAPTDPVLNGAMRKIIRSTEAADQAAAAKEIQDRCGADAALRKQVVDGCVLILHLGYGNDGAKKALRELQAWAEGR